MLTVSKLPNLEVLKLRNFAFCGEFWKTNECGFQSLKFLLISSTNLEEWETDGSHFPQLQHLVLSYCRSLNEIPYGFVEAPVLDKIELHCCGDSATASARKLLEEQQDLWNEMLTIYVTERDPHTSSENPMDSTVLDQSDDNDCRPGTSGGKVENKEGDEDYWFSDDEYFDYGSNGRADAGDEQD